MIQYVLYYLDEIEVFQLNLWIQFLKQLTSINTNF